MCNEDKARLGRMATFCLTELKRLYPDPKFHPGIPEKYRLHFSRSEWLQNVPLQVIENVFKRCVAEFKECLYVKIGPETNIPRIWFAWRDRHRSSEAAVKKGFGRRPRKESREGARKKDEIPTHGAFISCQ